MKKFINEEPFLIAEISANHNSSLTHAKKLISMAKNYGANAVKLQTYTPGMMTIKENVVNFKIKKGIINITIGIAKLKTGEVKLYIVSICNIDDDLLRFLKYSKSIYLYFS